MRIGSLFTGYGGLDMAVESFFNAETVWTSDIDTGACKIIAHRMPHAPNLGDLTKIDWSTVEPIDILTGGFPCQDLSHAGKRLGLKPGTRSGLWSHMAYAISQLRPRYVVAENVRGLLSASAHSDLEPCPWCVGGSGDGEPDLRALGAVLGDLAELGYLGSWIGLRAADVGAPHGRFRIFVVAADSVSIGRDGRTHEPLRGPLARAAAAWGGEGVGPSPDAGGERHGRGQDGRSLGRVDGTPEGEARQRERARGIAGDRSAEATSDPTCDGRDKRRPEPARLVRRPHAAVSGRTAWYEPAIHPAEQRRVMGQLSHAANDQAGPDPLLRDVRSSAGEEAVQRSARGSRSLPAQEELLAGVRQHETSGDEGYAPLASPEAPRVGMLGVRLEERPACPPHRPEPGEQRSGQPDHSLLVMSSEAALAGGPGEAHGRCGEGYGYGCSAWGQYAPAIHRWEICLGRIAPAPTEVGPKGGARLSPRAVEFMMGLPAGWVTDVPNLSRNAQLKALGNGVVPAQAYEALRRAFHA